MKKRFWIALLLMVFLIVPASPAAALDLTIRPDLVVRDLTLPNTFISRHQVIKAIPLYRVLVNGPNSHLYMTDLDWFNYLIENTQDTDDGYVGYISPVPLPYTVPLWQLTKIGGIEEYFVTSEANRDYVILKYGYQDRGIIGYVADLNDTDHGNTYIYQYYRGNKDQSGWFSDDDPWDADHYYHSAIVYPGSYTYEGPQFRAWSDASVLQEIYVTAPNGGETLTGGTKVDVNWNTLLPGGNISLYYTLDPAAGWSVMAENLDNTGSYSWTVPNNAATKAIVEARWTYNGIDSNCFDQSDRFITIKTGGGEIINWGLKFKPLDFSMLLAPATPTSLSANSGLFQKQLALYWKDNATNETAYVLERKTAGGAYAQLTQLAANQTKYIDKSAQTGNTYYYRIKAVSGSRSSAYSNEAAGSVYIPPKITIPPVETGQVSMLFTLNKNTYMVNGIAKAMDASPVAVGGRTLLPIRFAADPLGAVTLWDGTAKKVTVTMGTTKLEMWIGSNTAMVNGKAVLIDPENQEIKPIIINNRTMLPMRFVTENLGCEVEWIPALQQIKVDYLDPQPEPPMQ